MAVADERRQLSPGMQVSKGVTLRSPLGEGGMGAVWLADHAGLQTQVVVKFMIGNLDASPHARARFAREAAAAAQVKSPHVVQMLDHGITENDVPFIVMEHLVGKTLGQYMDDHGRLSPGEVVAVVSQVGKALSRVHAAGLLHRDIKPDNIFICEGDDELFVKLLDFGIVKDHASEPSLDGKTKTGQVVGTPFYMSPEQMNAEKNIDARSDLWSLAIVAFEALTGVRPFDGQSFGALAVAIVTTAPPRASSLNAALPSAVDAWFERALARDPGNRFATAREMSDALRAAFAGVSGVMSVPSSGEPSGRVAPRSSGSGPRSSSPNPSDSGADVHAKTERMDSVPRPATPIELDATQRQDQTESAALARSEPSRDRVDLPSATEERAAARRSSRRAVAIGVGAIVVLFGVVTLLAAKQGGMASSAAPLRSGIEVGALPAPSLSAAATQTVVATTPSVAPLASSAPMLATAAPTEPSARKTVTPVAARPAQKAPSVADVPPTATATHVAPPASTPAPRNGSDPLY